MENMQNELPIFENNLAHDYEEIEAKQEDKELDN